MTYWIETTNQSRRDSWEAALGMTALPVTTAQPIMIMRYGSKRPYYVVDAHALTALQRMRFLGWLWKSKHVTTKTAVAMLEAGVLIDGRDCKTVEPMADQPSASLFLPLLLLHAA